MNIELIRKPITLAMRNSMFNPRQCLAKTDICKKLVDVMKELNLVKNIPLTLNFQKLVLLD